VAKHGKVARFAGCLLAVLGLSALVAGPAGVATAVEGSASQPAGGGIGLRLVDVPLGAGGDPRAAVYIVDHLARGSVISRRIEVSNTAASAEHVVLYPAAATIATGSFLGAAGHTPNELSSWTSVSPSALDVPADGHAVATVTITVPHGAAPGEQYGAVWAEARSAPASDGGVTEVNRVGIRLYISVGPGGAPAAGFTIDSLTAMRSPTGEPMVLAAVRNTGGRALDMYGDLQLQGGPGGLSAGPFPATLGTTLAIHDTETVTIALDKRVPAGPWDARITLYSGLLKETARATITFPGVGASPAVIATAIRPGWLYPAIAVLVVLLLLAIVALLVELKRRRPRSDHSNVRPPVFQQL
jgi:hypothetical protein